MKTAFMNGSKEKGFRSIETARKKKMLELTKTQKVNNKKKIFNLLFYIIGIVVLTELDQITKALAEARLLGKPDFKIIGDAFVFSYLRNSGAAWGMLSGKINLFLVFTVIVMLIVTYVIINLPATRKYMPLLITCTLLVSGAVGNFIDRVRFGYVRDFIYFKLINFPVFNVADCYVTVSVALLIILILFVYKEDDFGFLKLSKKGDNNE